jgi:hypothetical protein
MPFARMMDISFSSVCLLPLERMAAITSERFRLVNMSGIRFFELNQTGNFPQVYG